MDKFLLYFCVAKRFIKIALGQKTGKRVLPLISYWPWPLSDAWYNMKFFLEKQKWVSHLESVAILNNFTLVIHYWEEYGTDGIKKDIHEVREKFSGSLYHNFVFFRH